MCGIAGVVNSPSTTIADVQRMIEKIAYRGKDEKGFQDAGSAVIGHARLAVVDPVNGKQPMSNEDGSVWVTFNGEIYNYVELREELRKKGHSFKSRCDTEVLVHLWEEEKEKMIESLIGMFAFFIWDEKAKKGILARDRQGIKPCYISEYKGGVAFCSEIKGLLTLPDFKAAIDNDVLLQTFAFNYAPPPGTCFKGVRHLMPGAYMLFDGDRAPQTRVYWEWPLMDERKTPGFDEFSSLMDDAIRLQMRFDVPGAMFLSGGLDSSVVLAHLSKQWDCGALEGIVLDFNEDGFSELAFARQAASGYGIRLNPLEVSPAFVTEAAEDVLFHADQPHGDFSFYLFYLLSREANRLGKIVMFNGDGPDEALLGFRHNEEYFSQNGPDNFSARSYYDLITYMEPDVRDTLLTSEFLRRRRDPFEVFSSILEKWKCLDPVEQVSAYELTSLMPGNNQIKGDRMGAGWSIEGRSPFLDHRVSELFARLPVPEKFKDGVGKHYLKKYALKFYPEELVFRPKTMPTMPIGEWIKSGLYDWAKDIFSTEDNIFKNGALLEMLDEHREGKRNHTRPIRIALMTKLWLKEFFHSSIYNF